MKIGDYNATKKVFQTTKATIFAADKIDESSDGKEEFILKSFQPNLSILEKNDIQRATDYFLNVAKLQQEIGNFSQYWAPIHVCSPWQNGAYYVTDSYKDSAQRLIDAKVLLSPQQLHKIVQSIVAGLVDLKQKCGRSHGNIKPSNILIQNLDRSSKTMAVLTDPSADKPKNKRTAELNDLQAIGDLIYRLVLHRAVSGDLTATLHGNSKKWNVLKKDSERWRKLCHDLMFTESYTLESLHQALSSLAPRSTSLTIPIISLGLIVIVSLFFYHGMKDKNPKEIAPRSGFDPNAWAGLCIEQQWFIPLYNEFIELDEEKRLLWNKDPDLHKISILFEPIGNQKIKLDPNSIAGNAKGSPDHLANTPPEAAKSELAVKDTKEALKIIGQVVNILNILEIEEIPRLWINKNSSSTSKWKLLTQFEEFQKKYASLGFDKLADNLEHMILSVKRPTSHTMGGIQQILKKGYAVKEIKERWEKLSALQNSIQSSEDTILKTFPQYIRNELLDKEGLDEFSEALNKLIANDSIAVELDTFLKTEWPNMDKVNFFKESIVHRDFTGETSKSAFASWLNEARDFIIVSPDPRVDYEKQLTEAISILENEIAWLEQKKCERIQEFRGDLSNLHEQIRSDLNSLPAINKYREQMEGVHLRISDALHGIEQKIKQERPVHEIKPEIWFHEVMKITFDSSPSINEEWIRRRDDLTQGITIQDLEKNQQQFSALRKKLDGIISFLESLNQDLSRDSWRPEEENLTPRKWHALFDDQVFRIREKSLAKALEMIPWEDGSPSLKFADFQEQKSWMATKEEYLGNAHHLGQILADFHFIEDRLHEGYLLREPWWRSKGKTSILTLYTNLMKQDSFLNDRLKDGLKEPVIKPIRDLMELEEKPKSILVEFAADKRSSLALALAAWKILVSTDWPHQITDSVPLKQINENIEEKIHGISNSKRKKRLQSMHLVEMVSSEKNLTELVLSESLEKIKPLYYGADYLSNFKPITLEIEDMNQPILGNYPSDLTNPDVIPDRDKLLEIKNRLREVTKEVKQGLDITRAVSPIYLEILTIKREGEAISGEIPEAERKEFQKLKDSFREKSQQIFARNPLSTDIEIFQDFLNQFTKVQLDPKTILERLQTYSFGPDNPVLQSEWEYWSHVRKTSSGEPSKENMRKEFQSELKNFRKLKRFLESLAENPEFRKSGEISQTFSESSESIMNRYAHQKENMLREACTNFFEKKIPLNLQGFVTTISKFQKQTTKFFHHFSIMKTLLDAGYTLEEQWSELTIKSLFDEGRADEKVFQLFQPEVQQISSRIDLLNTIETQSVHDAFLDIKERPEILFSVWKKLQNEMSWPSNRKEFDQGVHLLKKIQHFIDESNFDEIAPNRKHNLSTRMTSEAPKCWKRIFNHTLNTEDSTYVIQNRNIFYVEDTKLPEWLKFNVLLTKYRSMTIESLEDQYILKIRDEFSSSLKDLNIGNQSPDVVEFIRKLDNLRAHGGKPDTSKRGPGKFGWKANEEEDPQTITYSKSLNGNTHELHFSMIPPQTLSNSNLSYLSSTEVSIGLIKDLVESNNLLDKDGFLESLTPYDPFGDSRLGPRAWEWDSDGETIIPSREWLVPSPEMADLPPYPKELHVSPSTLSHPIQYISPSAAFHIAKSLGCRFPSMAEFQSAIKISNSKTKNLRSQNFLLQKRYIKGLGLADPPWPDGGIFIPDSLKKVARGVNAGVKIKKETDAALWFLPPQLSEKGRFQNLFGNVAEYILKNDIDPMIELSFHAIKNKIGIIGGSALSPAELKMERFFPLNLEDALDGYSDVGFRLAFGAPPDTLASRWSGLLANQNLLPKK